MKFFGNWQVKGNKVIIADTAYFEEGATGLPSLVGSLTTEEIAKASKLIENLTFAELKKIVKANSDSEKMFKLTKKLLKEKWINHELTDEQFNGTYNELVKAYNDGSLTK